MAQLTMYTNSWCVDCRRAKQFLRDRGIPYNEVNIEQSPEAEALVCQVNNGRCKVPTMELDGRYFALSPFDPCKLAEELKIPVNVLKR
jgi:mycoredoxin